MENSQVSEGSKTERKSLIERDGTDDSVDDIDFDGVNVESCFRYANNKSHYGKYQYKISSLDVCGERGCNNKNAIGEFQYVEDDKINESFNEASGKGKPAKMGNEERSVVLGVLNIRSIITKFSSIYGLIHEGLDIFVLTESWHGSADNISIGYKKITLPLVTAFKVLAVKLKINELDYILLAIYRPGSEQLTTSFYDKLISVLECVTIISSRILLAGDFNIPMEKSNNPNVVNLREIFEMFQLINQIDEPTHILGGTLDLIVTSHNIAVSEAKVYPSGIYSDHGLIQCFDVGRSFISLMIGIAL
ncbi:hypothetical protein HELRODRAFT_163765 [Helobdella robusta]|uniref:Endonuclease/exonuclease/phosphatase domain-containing protein n=1 Tax=Helobdella robusta TaxID=6412 RepID=T1EUF9_HELRO|nr:hypothetical protein HELRODRAFT_163765 [Helobdella robusta]ESN96670.1 hypothetical protein HELRODRAFT_163765 [Helobdella robusta]